LKTLRSAHDLCEAGTWQQGRTRRLRSRCLSPLRTQQTVPSTAYELRMRGRDLQVLRVPRAGQGNNARVWRWASTRSQRTYSAHIQPCSSREPSSATRRGGLGGKGSTRAGSSHVAGPATSWTFQSGSASAWSSTRRDQCAGSPAVVMTTSRRGRVQSGPRTAAPPVSGEETEGGKRAVLMTTGDEPVVGGERSSVVGAVARARSKTLVQSARLPPRMSRASAKRGLSGR
jgi:hypothetical protein